MSAPNPLIIWRTFGAEGARQIPEALKGGGFSAKRAKWRRDFAHNPRTTLPGSFRGGPTERQGAWKMSTEKHTLNCDNIDQLDEINGDVQLAFVWCETHKIFEWHSISDWRVDNGGSFTVTSKPVEW